MEKLSAAGKLYLKDYLTLEEARKDMERFLNSVLDEIKNLFKEEIEGLVPEGFEINTWIRKNSKGAMSISYFCTGQIKYFREDSSDLHIVCKDIRVATDLTESTCVKINLQTPKVASDVENKLIELSQVMYNENIYEPNYIRLDLNNSSNSAEKIVDQILKKCIRIKEMIAKF
ncbi:MAG: hypothetical protein ACQEQF_09610 [Bacillota bacterium]